MIKQQQQDEADLSKHYIELNKIKELKQSLEKCFRKNMDLAFDLPFKYGLSTKA